MKKIFFIITMTCYPLLTLFCSILIIFINTAFAQSSIKISGTVVDKKLNTAMPYVNISIKNNSIGTVTNESGEFELYVPRSHANDTLVVSCIGYKSLHIPVLNLTLQSAIALEEMPIQLNEVVITTEGAKKIIEGALHSIPIIFPSSPYLMESFHRSWERLEFADSIGCPGTLIEAAVTIYDPGYVKKKPGDKLNEDIYTNEIRRSALIEGWNYGGQNTLKDLLDGNLIKYPTGNSFVQLKSFLDFPNTLVYSWEGTTTLNDEELSIIKVEIINATRFPAYYKIYVSGKDHAILRFEVHGEKSEIEYASSPWHIRYLNTLYIFKRYGQKPYLSYSKKQYTINYVDQVNKKILRTETYYRELLINNIILTGVEEHRRKISANKAKNTSLALQNKTYNEDFWKNYTVIKENPTDKEIIKYFEKKQDQNNPCQPRKKNKK